MANPLGLTEDEEQESIASLPEHQHIDYYLIEIRGDVEPVVYPGFHDDNDVLRAAQVKRMGDPEMHSGLFRAWVIDGALVMDAFSNRELEA